MDQDFGVAVIGLKPVAFAFQFTAQLKVVVYFAVEYDRDLAIAVPHGLGAVIQINDCQPAMAKEKRMCGVDVPAFAVRAAVGDGGNHAGQIFLISLADESCNPAHTRRSIDVETIAHLIDAFALRLVIGSRD